MDGMVNDPKYLPGFFENLPIFLIGILKIEKIS